jgi:beta-phosphoglucomutase-like phosphatase (HAD superfamily)
VPAGATFTRAIEAVVFDLDGVLIDSETAWSAAREAVATDSGGRWHGGAQTDMMGMSSTEWSWYMHDELAVPMPPERISEQVVERLGGIFREHLPLAGSAPAAVEALGDRWPLAIASSSNRPLIDLVLEVSGLAGDFQASVSSEEVARGKPAPDVYQAAAGRLGVDAGACVAVEDSANGLRAASAAGMRIVAIPNPDFPPDGDSLGLAHTVLWSLRQLVPAVVEALESAPAGRRRGASSAQERTRSRGGADAVPGLEGVSFAPHPGPGDSEGGQIG